MTGFCVRGGLVASVVVVLSSATGGCSSPTSSTPSDAGAQPEAGVTCLADSRSQTYVANLTNPGTSKVFQFILVSADPAPPTLDTNVWTLKVVDMTGAPVTDAQLTIPPPFMPQHNHSSSQTPQITPNGDGTFKIDNINFFMVGLFKVTPTATSQGKSDSADFYFCVQ